MITVRGIEAADAAPWRVLWRAYLDFYSTTLPDAVYATAFARLVDPDVTDYHGLLAVRDGTPVGLAHFIYHRHGWQPEDVCYLQDLYVAPDARGSGAGRALIEAVCAAADANGTPSVYWLTQRDNAQARRLYVRIGTKTDFIKYRR
jgi:GNAT superfamily N-acetyltransferase